MTKMASEIWIVAAMSQDRVIAVDDKLPWHETGLPKDKREYLKTIKGLKLLYGFNTYSQTPDHSREGNEVVVLSSRTRQELGLAEEVELINTPQKIPYIKPSKGTEKIIANGGGGLYEAAIAYADVLKLTIIEKKYAKEAEKNGSKITFFPEVNPATWVEDRASRTIHKHQDLGYSIRLYRRR